MQEALTNVIKHAGSARASVSVQRSERVLELEVSDDGRGDAIADTTGAGHGLVGMRERLALYAGELEAGPTPAGGFRVRARIPLDAAAQPVRTAAPSGESSDPCSEPAPEHTFHSPGRPRARPGVAAIASANLLLSSHRHGAVALNVLVAVLMGAVALLWRKQALLFATATMALAVVSTAWLTDIRTFPLAIYVLVLPPYALAAYEDLPRGLAGLAVLIAGACAVNLVGARPTTVGDLCSRSRCSCACSPSVVRFVAVVRSPPS